MHNNIWKSRVQLAEFLLEVKRFLQFRKLIKEDGLSENRRRDGEEPLEKKIGYFLQVSKLNHNFNDVLDTFARKFKEKKFIKIRIENEI